MPEITPKFKNCDPEKQNLIAALKTENLKLQKKIFKLQAENFTLKNRIKILEKETLKPKVKINIVKFGNHETSH